MSEGLEEDLPPEGPQFACVECGRPAPSFESVEILAWRGGAMAHFLGERDPLMLGLRCPECGGEDDEL